jgi:hypothetical protein
MNVPVVLSGRLLKRHATPARTSCSSPACSVRIRPYLIASRFDAVAFIFADRRPRGLLDQARLPTQRRGLHERLSNGAAYSTNIDAKVTNRSAEIALLPADARADTRMFVGCRPSIVI